MKVVQIRYESVRPHLKTGDVVFFGGKGGLFTSIIKLFTFSPYSHAAIVWRTEGDLVMLMESTTLLKGTRGVQPTRLSERIADYKGLVDIAPLSPDARRKFDCELCAARLFELQGYPYDMRGAGFSGPGQWFRIPGKARHDALFCSELVDAAHCAAGLECGKDRTPTPEELSRRTIFSAFYRVKES